MEEQVEVQTRERTWRECVCEMPTWRYRREGRDFKQHSCTYRMCMVQSGEKDWSALKEHIWSGRN